MYLIPGICKKSRKTFFKWVRKLPTVRKIVDSKMKKINDDYISEIEERLKTVNCIGVLPKEGLSGEDLIEEVNKQLSLGPFHSLNHKTTDPSRILLNINSTQQVITTGKTAKYRVPCIVWTMNYAESPQKSTAWLHTPTRCTLMYSLV